MSLLAKRFNSNYNSVLLSTLTNIANWMHYESSWIFFSINYLRWIPSNAIGIKLLEDFYSQFPSESSNLYFQYFHQPIWLPSCLHTFALIFHNIFILTSISKHWITPFIALFLKWNGILWGNAMWTAILCKYFYALFSEETSLMSQILQEKFSIPHFEMCLYLLTKIFGVTQIIFVM